MRIIHAKLAIVKGLNKYFGSELVTLRPEFHIRPRTPKGWMSGTGCRRTKAPRHIGKIYREGGMGELSAPPTCFSSIFGLNY